MINRNNHTEDTHVCCLSGFFFLRLSSSLITEGKNPQARLLLNKSERLAQCNTHNNQNTKKHNRTDAENAKTYTPI